MNACRACAAGVERLLELGPQPVTNRFPADPSAPEYAWPMTLALCSSCGLLQLADPVPASEVEPRVSWISYKEPEGHLDELARVLATLPGLGPGSVFAGVTVKDDTLLDRLEKLGFPKRWRLDLKADLGVGDPNAGIETLQERLTVEAARGIAAERGKADVLLVRHVLEHAHDTGGFVAALKELVKPEGAIVFEVPDNARGLENEDYGALWEEHILLLTADTFRASLSRWGLQVERFESYPYPMENSLVAIVRARPSSSRHPVDIARERARALEFARGLAPYGERFREFLSRHRGAPIALFGAGHRSATFINLLELSRLVDFVVDDDPNKRGLYMPGSRLPIIASTAIAEKGVRLCLLCLSPESEERVVARNASFAEAGGTFVSVFPDSKLSWQRLAAKGAA